METSVPSWSRLEEARAAISAALVSLLEQMGVVDAASLVTVDYPTEAGHGDFTCNVALKVARVLKRNPREVAQELAAGWPLVPGVAALEAAGPGFLNFSLDTAWVADVVRRINAHPTRYGESPVGQGERVLIEFVSANPVGPMVVVNGRAAAIGDSLARIMRLAGYAADREFYVNNGGVQVEKLGQAIWLRLREMAGEEVESSWPEGVYPGDYVKDLAKQYQETYGLPDHPDYARLGEYGARHFQAQHQAVLGRFGVHFERWFEEKTLRDAGAAEAVVEELRQRGFTREEDGALWFESTRFGDDKDRVIVKSNGELTYMVPDVAYHAGKFRRGYDRAIDLLGPDHHGYVNRIRAAMEALMGKGDQLEVILVQMVRLVRDGEAVKMSKRRGQYVPLEDMLEDAGIDAARFFFVERAPETPMDFDLGLAQLKTQANPVYYVQYAGARIRSILRQVDEELWTGEPDLSHLQEPAERQVIMDLARFPEVVARAAVERAPQLLPRYLTELAAGFHAFYRLHRVLGEDAAVSRSRIALLKAVLHVLERGAWCIGVSIPESM